jgi:uncharacterized protein
MTDYQPIIEALTLYPIKGCQGISLRHAYALPEGMAMQLADGTMLCDRQYMVVTPDGEFVTQRETPLLASIQIEPTFNGLRLSTPINKNNGSVEFPADPAMALSSISPIERVSQVWSFTGLGWDMGPEVSQWLSAVLQKAVALVKFSLRQPRACNDIGSQLAHTFFADSFPYLVIGTQSVTDLQARLSAHHQDVGLVLPANRFRANIVMSGLPAYEEDLLSSISIINDDAAKIEFELVSKCVRCNVPGIDQLTGKEQPQSPTALLDTFRLDPVLGGSTIGMNALLRRSVGQGAESETLLKKLQIGDLLVAELNF